MQNQTDSGKDIKQVPLHKRLRTYVDGIKKKSILKHGKTQVLQPQDDSMINVPIFFGFDSSGLPVGRVLLNKEAARLVTPDIPMVISPAYLKEEDSSTIIYFGLIPPERAIPPKNEEKEKQMIEEPVFNNQIGLIILIAVVCGVLAIIALVIRTQYMK